ncbi:hypothetical protein HID58_009056, partial [Brassica napus]
VYLTLNPSPPKPNRFTSQNSAQTGTSFPLNEILIQSLSFGSGTTHDICFRYAASNSSLNLPNSSLASSGAISSLGFSGNDVTTFPHASFSNFSAYCFTFPSCLTTQSSPRRTFKPGDERTLTTTGKTAPRLCTAELCRRSYKESGGSPTRYVPTPETSTAPPDEHHGDGLVVVREEGEVVHDVARERVNAAADDRRSGGFLLNRRFEVRHHEPRRVAEFRQRVDHLSSDGGGRVEEEDGLDLDEEAREGLVHVEEPEHFLRREFLDLGRVLREGEESQRSFLSDVGEGGLDYVEGGGEDVIGEKPLSEKEGPNG